MKKQPNKAQTEQVLKNRKTLKTHLLITAIIILIALIWQLLSPNGNSIFNTLFSKNKGATIPKKFSIFSFSFLSTATSWICYIVAFKMLWTRSTYTQTEEEFVVESLQQVTGTMYEYVYDVLYLNWFCQVMVMLFSRWFAYIILLVVVSYVGYQIYEWIHKLLSMKDQLLAPMGISPDMMKQFENFGKKRDFNEELKEIDEQLKQKNISNHVKTELIARKRKIEKEAIICFPGVIKVLKSPI